MKFNWGTGIALFYAVFVLSMVGVVFASRRHDPGLMQKNYYDLDLNYQARLEKKQNAASLASLPQVRFSLSDKHIHVQFPAGMGAVSGTAKLYRSATTHDDFAVNIEDAGKLAIPTENLAPGRWHIELDWEASGEKYFWETVIVVIEG